jgi:hypothetical protein
MSAELPPAAQPEQPVLPEQTERADAPAVQRALHEIQSQLGALQAQIATLHETQAALLARLAEPDSLAAAPGAAAPGAAASPAASTQQAASAPAQQTRRRARGSASAPVDLHIVSSEVAEPELLPNGINGQSGQLLVQLDSSSASELARARREPHTLHALHTTKRQEGEQQHLGVVFGIDEDKLEQTRWAVIVNSEDDAALLEALLPLIRHRSAQQGCTLPDDDALAVRAGETCAAWLERLVPDPTMPWQRRPPVLLYLPGETSTQWLARHGVVHGPVDPRQGVPFYLLIAARPGAASASDLTTIPFGFQYELDMFWGVGRLCFTDAQGAHDLGGYASYARRVVEIETTPPAYRKHMVYFGTRHELDPSTQRSAKELMVPLTEGRNGQPPIAARYDFAQQVFLGDEAGHEASHAHLQTILRGESEHGPPALFFSATHGVGLPPDDADLIGHQGALLCQDWTGFGNIERKHWYAASDLPSNARIAGLIAICFACYGAGCPREDEFVFRLDEEADAPTRPLIAPFDLVAQLPQHLLRQGALAVLGHVDRAWTHSFSRRGVPAQSQAFEDLLARILAGKRMGFATDQFNLRQGVIASILANELEQDDFGKYVDPRNLSSLWVARNDARNYALLGDPAVRLPIERMTAV